MSGVVFFLAAVVLFVAAILVATQEEFDAYLTPAFQAAEEDVLRRRNPGDDPRPMSNETKVVDPSVGVAPVSVATGYGRPGGRS